MRNIGLPSTILFAAEDGIFERSEMTKLTNLFESACGLRRHAAFLPRLGQAPVERQHSLSGNPEKADVSPEPAHPPVAPEKAVQLRHHLAARAGARQLPRQVMVLAEDLRLGPPQQMHEGRGMRKQASPKDLLLELLQFEAELLAE